MVEWSKTQHLRCCGETRAGSNPALRINMYYGMFNKYESCKIVRSQSSSIVVYYIISLPA